MSSKSYFEYETTTRIDIDVWLIANYLFSKIANNFSIEIKIRLILIFYLFVIFVLFLQEMHEKTLQ